MVGGIVCGSCTGGRLSNGVYLTGSHSSSGQGWIVARGVSTPLLSCNMMGSLDTSPASGWYPRCVNVHII